MVIAVDFDGTIVEHRYPRIGEEIPFAIDTLKLLQQEKHRLILWSVREGALLDEAVEWCKARGLEFYAINKDYPEEQKDHQGFSRKLKADLFIDDRNLGGLPDWGVIYEMVKGKKTFADIYPKRRRYSTTEEKEKMVFFLIGEEIVRNSIKNPSVWILIQTEGFFIELLSVRT